TYYTSAGQRQSTLLPGRFGSEESREAFRRLLTRLDRFGGVAPALEDLKRPAFPNLSIGDLILKYMDEHVFGYYVDPDTKEPTGEATNFRCAMRPLNRIFGDLPALEFGPQCLVAVRQAMIDGSWLTEDEKKKHMDAGHAIRLARATINARIARIKMMFR